MSLFILAVFGLVAVSLVSSTGPVNAKPLKGAKTSSYALAKANAGKKKKAIRKNTKRKLKKRKALKKKRARSKSKRKVAALPKKSKRLKRSQRKKLSKRGLKKRSKLKRKIKLKRSKKFKRSAKRKRTARHSKGRILTNGKAWRCVPGKLKRVLKRVAKRYGTVSISSTHRSRRHNRRVGGKSKSYHLRCRAVDFRVRGRTRGLYAYLRKQSGVGGLKRYRSGYFHIDNGPRRTWR